MSVIESAWVASGTERSHLQAPRCSRHPLAVGQLQSAPAYELPHVRASVVCGAFHGRSSHRLKERYRTGRFTGNSWGTSVGSFCTRAEVIQSDLAAKIRSITIPSLRSWMLPALPATVRAMSGTSCPIIRSSTVAEAVAAKQHVMLGSSLPLRASGSPARTLVFRQFGAAVSCRAAWNTKAPRLSTNQDFHSDKSGRLGTINGALEHRQGRRTFQLSRLCNG